MAGGLIQLVAYGAQDVYLTGNPQTNFFETVYKRHTNFSMEHIEQSFNDTPGPDKRVIATISRNGDLVHDCYLRFENTDGHYHSGENILFTNLGIGYINNIDVKIGGQLIDRHYGDFLEAWAELTEKNYGLTECYKWDGTTDSIQNSKSNAEQFISSNFQIGKPQPVGALSPYQLNTLSGGLISAERGFNPVRNLFLPLRFWFCKDIGSSLPLISLQYHEVDIILNLTSLYAGSNTPSCPFENISLWANYIYLDTDERRRFAQVSHEYLIEQVQKQDFTIPSQPTNLSCKLVLNHPVKELIWIIRKDKWGDNTDATDGSLGESFSLDKDTNPIQPYIINTEVRLILNGHDRFEKQTIDYFTRYQPYKYHQNLSRSLLTDTIAVYSFALKPEEHQPSGTCNFSRINTSILEINNFNNEYHPASEDFSNLNTPSTLTVFAINYNVLRIMSGMGGLAYSN